jgi:mRNA interferase YafQ
MENDTPQQKKLSENSSSNIYILVHSRAFRKSLKKYKRSGTGYVPKVMEIILKLAKGEMLDKKYHDHKLNGSMENFRECHVAPDLLIVYRIKEETRELLLEYLGSHSELF